MLSATTIILDYVCPSLGLIFGNAMFTAPYKAVKDAVARGYLGDLNPTPWAFMTGNCAGWVAYGLLKHNYFIFFANAPGFLLSIWFNLCAAKLQYQDHMATDMRQSFVQFLQEKQIEDQQQDGENEDATGSHYNSRSGEEDAQPLSKLQKATDLGLLVWKITTHDHMKVPAPHERIVMAMAIIWTFLLALMAFSGFTQNQKELLIGFSVNFILLFFYGAPLNTIYKILSEKSTASIHRPFMWTSTANGSFWCAYGLSVQDPFVFVPNGIGAGLGVIQIVLCTIFPRRGTTGNSDDSSVSSEGNDGRAVPVMDVEQQLEIEESTRNSNSSDIEDDCIDAK